MQNPIHFQRLSRRKLNNIPGLSSAEADSVWDIIQKRDDLKNWKSLHGLLNHEVLELLESTIIFNRDEYQTGNIRWRVKQKSGVKDYQLYSNTSIISRNGYSGVITTERDPGEMSLLDHWAGGIQINDRGGFSTIIIGQFLLGYGQGLAYGSPMGIAKSTTAVSNADRSYSRIRLNSSSLESIGLLGATARYNIGTQSSVQAHYAKTPRDGAFEEGELTISASGLHLTESAINKSNALIENVRGLAYEFTGGKITAGIQFSNLYYQQDGNNEQIQEGNFGSFWMGGSWFGHETAVDQFGRSAHYSFVRFLTEEIHWTIGHRWYAPGYISYFGNGFGEFSGTENETGFYLGAKWSQNGTQIQGYLDQFREILSSEDPARSGSEFLFYAKQRLQERMYLSGYFKNETKEVFDKSELNGLVRNFTSLRNKNQFRLQWDYRTAEKIDMKWLMDMIHVEIAGKNYTGVQWSVKAGIPIRKKMRSLLFISPYFVEQSDASTYYFIMPVTGTMQLLRQTGRGLIFGTQLRYQFSPQSRGTLFYMIKNELPAEYSHLLALQMDVAF